MGKYRLSFSQEWKQRLRILLQKARAEGRLEQAQEVFKAVMSDLEPSPESLGEKLYQLKHLDISVEHIVRLPWSFHVGIDAKRYIVYLSRIDLLD